MSLVLHRCGETMQTQIFRFRPFQFTRMYTIRFSTILMLDQRSSEHFIVVIVYSKTLTAFSTDNEKNKAE